MSIIINAHSFFYLLLFNILHPLYIDCNLICMCIFAIQIPLLNSSYNSLFITEINYSRFFSSLALCIIMKFGNFVIMKFNQDLDIRFLRFTRYFRDCRAKFSLIKFFEAHGIICIYSLIAIQRYVYVQYLSFHIECFFSLFDIKELYMIQS